MARFTFLQQFPTQASPHYPTLDPIYYAPFGNPDAVS